MATVPRMELQKHQLRHSTLLLRQQLVHRGSPMNGSLNSTAAAAAAASASPVTAMQASGMTEDQKLALVRGIDPMKFQALMKVS